MRAYCYAFSTVKLRRRILKSTDHLLGICVGISMQLLGNNYDDKADGSTEGSISTVCAQNIQVRKQFCAKYKLFCLIGLTGLRGSSVLPAISVAQKGCYK